MLSIDWIDFVQVPIEALLAGAVGVLLMTVINQGKRIRSLELFQEYIERTSQMPKYESPRRRADTYQIRPRRLGGEK